MRRAAPRAVTLLLAAALLLICSASAGASSSGIRGTVLDATCETGCEVPCPPPPSCRAERICLQPGPAIVCPQRRSFDLPPYTGENGQVIVRRQGSATVLARVIPDEGRFSLRLGAGHYVVRTYVAEECWSGERRRVTVSGGHYSPLEMEVRDNCVAHPYRGAELG
ncbi:MAG: hypothetical protein H0X42_09030 [Solirubrobacterales bacterium]|nr:hypothetical protein [Solirubrobacterales bacterium]